jgi:replicative DNA helicase
MSTIIGEVVDENNPDRGVRFGFDAIEQKRIRLEPGTVTIIGARPAMGKTAFMLSCAWRQAQAGHRPFVAELEMKDRNLGRRRVCGESGVPVWKSKRNSLSQQDRDQMARWYVEHGDQIGRIMVDEASSMSVSTLAAKVDRAKRKHGIDVVWVDYIGLLQPSTKQRPGYDRMTAISNELRVLAKDMDLPFAVLAQLSRPVKGQAVKPPALTDLRDSGEIEQDAEAVVFLHRPKYYDQGADDNVDVIIAKNRDGDDGIATLFFDGPGTRMLDWPSEVPRFDARIPSPNNRIEPNEEAPF